MNDNPNLALDKMPGGAGLAEWLARRNLLVTGNERIASAKHEDLLRGVPVIIPDADGVPTVTSVALDEPNIFTGHIEFETLDSFMAYLLRHGNPSRSKVYVAACGVPTRENPSLLSAVFVIDDHSATAAGWKAWRGDLDVCLDPQAVLIIDRISREFSMDDLATWIEHNEDAFADPPAAKMLELATSFRAQSSSRFDRGRNLSNGDLRFEFVEETTATAGRTGEMVIPAVVTLRFPILVDGPAVQVTCRFRYRMKEKSPLFTLFLPNLREILRTSAEELLADLRARAGDIPVYRATLID